jgi:fumarylacetoacetate (FAA) hydrolase
MKLASLKNGRDGKLVVVSRDLTKYRVAAEAAQTLQAALDDWDSVGPQLEELATEVEKSGETFDQTECDSPLPRAYQWADGSAYVNHVELVRKARNAEMPERRGVGHRLRS